MDQTLPVTPLAPTTTEKWLRCPTLGHLSERWEPTGPWTPNLLLGRCIDQGLAALFLGKDLAAAETATIECLNVGYQENDEWPLDAVQTMALKGLRAAAKTTVKEILAREKVVSVQLDVGEGKLDLVTQRESDGLVITDHKVKLHLKADWVQKELLSHESDWQFWDYTWRATEYFGRPVTKCRVHLIVLAPQTKCYPHEWEITPENLKNWLRGAERTWPYIGELRKLPLSEVPMWLTSCNGRYGRCVFYDACHVSERDPVKMRGLYNPKE